MASRVALSVALALVGLASVGPASVGRAMGNDASASSGGDGLRAGFGSAPLPAPEGGPLAGYGGLRTRRAHGVLDAPEARALVLDQGDVRLALVTLDLVISRPGLRDRLREHASQRDVDSVLLAATHTHSGPGGYLEGWWAERITAGEERPGAVEEIGAAARLALDRALDDLAPARLGAISTHSDIAENRRFAEGPDETHLPLIVLRFAPERAPIVVASHSAHPIILSPDSHSYSADYVGHARHELQRQGWRALLLPGALGDQQPKSALGPLWSDGVDEQRAQAADVGTAFAAAVLAAAGPLAAPHSRIELRHAERAWALPEIRLRRFCPLWWLGPFASGFAREFLSSSAPVQVLQVGPAWIAGVPAEPTSEVGASIRDRLPEDSVRFAVAHANDWTGNPTAGAPASRP